MAIRSEQESIAVTLAGYQPDTTFDINLAQAGSVGELGAGRAPSPRPISYRSIGTPTIEPHSVQEPS
jgi:hypothetical protein